MRRTELPNQALNQSADPVTALARNPSAPATPLYKARVAPVIRTSRAGAVSRARQTGAPSLLVHHRENTE